MLVIGVSPGESLSERAIKELERASLVYASKRLARLAIDMGLALGNRLVVQDSIAETIKRAKSARSNVAVLASGDPMFFGIGRLIAEAIPPGRLVVMPSLSSVQLAFARLGIAWDDAEFVSLHGGMRRRWRPEDLPLLCSIHGKLAILTGAENTPASIAAHLPTDARVHVLERLGYEDERVRSGRPSAMRKMRFREPNILLVVSPSGGAAIGLTEDAFEHERGLITKDEVRAIVLHKLMLPRAGVMWDIGAGSGSVGIEAKRISPELDVYAIESNAKRAAQIRRNSARHAHVSVIPEPAPAALAGLPDPDRIFVGGSGGGLEKIIPVALKRLKPGGILVMTFIALENISSAQAVLGRRRLLHEVTSISVSRSRPIAGKSYLKADNQVYIFKVQS